MRVTAIERPELIFFDLGDTLVRAHPSWAEIYLIVCREFGLSIQRADLDRAFMQAMEDGAWAFEGPFEATEEAAWARIREFDSGVLASLGHRDLPEAFFRRLAEAFAARESWFIFPDVVPALDAIEVAGIRRAVISNWTWSAPELLHDLELASRFETVAISARVGYQKPARGIFDHALQATGVRPERVIHIGDSYRADVQGAQAVGIQPVLIDRAQMDDPGRERSPLPDGEDVPVVRDLYGLLELIGVGAPAVARGA